MSVEKYRKAGNIVKEAKEKALELVEVGVSALELAENIEEFIESKGGKPAFPCNISINETAAHYTPSEGDELVFREGDLIKIDIGAHVDGYIGDSAFTASLSGDTEPIEAAESGLKAGIRKVEHGVTTSEIGEAIEKAILDKNCRPIVNLTGHGLKRYVQHSEPNIPNIKVNKGIVLEKGDVIAIEPFTTKGNGKVREGSKGQIYSLEKEKNVRSREARSLLKQIKEFKGLPFAERWLKGGKRKKFYLKKLVKEDVIRNYPVLKEVSGKPIAQAEESVIIKENGCEIITA